MGKSELLTNDSGTPVDVPKLFYVLLDNRSVALKFTKNGGFRLRPA